MRAIPMKDRLTGKRIFGCIWAGQGGNWRWKENYFQCEDNKLVTAVLGCASGSFWMRCKGARCEITLRGSRRQILGKSILILPRGKSE